METKFKVGDKVRLKKCLADRFKEIYDEENAVIPERTYTVLEVWGPASIKLEKINNIFPSIYFTLVNKSKKRYHKEKCVSCIRNVTIDAYGRKLTLSGQYAFNYSITIESITGNITVEVFKNGTIARKRFNELKKR